MIPALRQAFNEAWAPAGYARFLALLADRCGMEVPFRCAETPCFMPRALLQTMCDAGRALAEQVIGSPAALDAARRRIPEPFRVPDEASRPLFVQADFGIDAAGDPKLVEIQGFPSLYAFQPLLGETYRDAYGLPSELPTLLSGLDAAGYDRVLGEALVGDADPAETVLLELFPEKQKTRPDFLLTEKRFGVRTVCATTVRQEGKRLFTADGAPIRRIYNRVIADEVVRTGVALPFALRDELDVEWAGHPNWYFLLSKCSLPFLRHETAPQAHFVADLATIPDDLDDWVLKPLFSFAGLGVTIGPTREQVESVDDPQGWLLQRRVAFVPTIETPEGPTKVEVRIMLVDTPSGLTPVTALLRMGRGKLLGVDQNRDATWIGASAAFAV